MRKTALVMTTLIAAATLLVFAQQDKSKRPSPPATAEAMVTGKKISIDYSRPSMKGRKVFGGIVPYGQVWRTGANEATTLTTEADLQIGTLAVPKGTYTVYTIPEQGQWTLIVNKQTGQWGTEYAQGQDLGRVPMKVSKTNKPVEMFTIYRTEGPRRNPEDELGEHRRQPGFHGKIAPEKSSCPHSAHRPQLGAAQCCVCSR
jgi:hypothetical protein